MIGKRSVMTAVLAVAAVYAVTPYLTIWSIADALRRGDAKELAATIDWDAVRAGLKEDIAEGIVGDLGGDGGATTQVVATNTLPPFGASFMSGIAGNVVDREITPEHLAVMVRQLAPAREGFSLPFSSVRYAFFAGPTTFLLSVLCPGEDAHDAPLRIRLDLRGDRWKVTRVWVPQDVIDMANERT